ncbi:helix-turn-helix transcriptional regulator [Flavobacterium sp. F-65]|uniref:Helix-turn-helix transcriptional regulator n=1 Tax=Flavobacterium pisciphilum TaxID=2893755 RepID=A0ABS8MZ67_9FLAO|nr:helix-turn-helix transcriptional regulator [Flavobacterium sp. F-65]MCC9074076.1 helix-turn-helix transcriptional regulator [Flavobacterium sp. F-65]
MSRKLNENKIAFSEIGGIYIGKNLQTDFHKHYAVMVIFSLDKPFELAYENQTKSFDACIIQPNVTRKFTSDKNSEIAFIYIEPYTELGLKLLDLQKGVTSLSSTDFKPFLEILETWQNKTDNRESFTTNFINKLVDQIVSIENITPASLDKRILKSIKEANQDITKSQKQIAESVGLSVSRFAFLFKKSTGITFKQYVLHTKLVKSVKSILFEENLTQVAHQGGFADQAHFTRTYLKTFGVLPSHSVK